MVTTRAPVARAPNGRRCDAKREKRRAHVAVRARRGKGFLDVLRGDADADGTKGEGGASAKTRATSSSERCPCGGGSEALTYGSCCKRFHDGDAYPEDPVTLMRSRFSAYAKGKGLYVLETTHPDNPLLKEGSKTKEGKVVSTLAADVEATCKKVRFYDLDIVRDVAGRKKGDEREHLVGFKYKCRVVAQKGFNELPEETHAELSTFRTVDGVWKFVDGIQGST